MSHPLSVSEATLRALRCPETGQPLSIASKEEHAHFFGEDKTVEQSLITDDKAIAYPIRDGFPHLVSSEKVVR
ncbi:MAG: Trm112 family protein [Verrucomicrobiota bacterium]